MITAVQESDHRGGSRRTTRVVFGHPRRRLAGEHGPICLFPPDALVALRITRGRRARGFVFRTLHGPEALACTLSGVQPHVRLLISTGTQRRFARAIELLLLLEQQPHLTIARADEVLLRASPSVAGSAPIALVAKALFGEQW
jgi:hypothetical protein